MTKILLRRAGALGDVILTTAVAARLRREDPEAQIDVQTGCATVYEGHGWVGGGTYGWKNPHVNKVSHFTDGRYDRIVNLDMAHEERRRIHQIDAYMEVAFGDHNGPKEIHFPLNPTAPWTIYKATKGIITIHPNISWQSRTLPQTWWQVLANRFVAAGYGVVVLGTGRDHMVQGPGIFDSRNKMNLYDQAAAIHHSAAFVCGGSGLFMLAGTTETPTVVLLTISKAEHCLPYRRGELGWNFFPIIPDIECYGCNQEYGPVTYVGCLRKEDQYRCIGLIERDLERVVSTTLDAIANDRRKAEPNV